MQKVPLVPKFEPGERVKYDRINKYVVVDHAFSDGDGSYRYYVTQAGVGWSVPESALSKVKTAPNDIS